MTIEQTVEIPADRRIILDVPPQIPTGSTARLELIWLPQRKKTNDLAATIEKIRELCKDSPVTVDSFLELRRHDKELEEKQYRQFFGDNN